MAIRQSRQLVTVFLPAYNEQASIKSAVERLRRILPTARLVVIDDGSADETARTVSDLELPAVEVIRSPVHLGKGGALKLGISRAEITTDYFAFLDADLDIDPGSIPIAIEWLERDSRIDAIFGSKLHPESNVSTTRRRLLYSQLFRAYLRLFLQISVSDTQTGLKIFRTDTVSHLVLDPESNGWTYDVELTLLLQDSGLEIAECPVNLAYRLSTNINFVNSARALKEITILSWGRREPHGFRGAFRRDNR